MRLNEVIYWLIECLVKLRLSAVIYWFDSMFSKSKIKWSTECLVKVRLCEVKYWLIESCRSAPWQGSGVCPTAGGEDGAADEAACHFGLDSAPGASRLYPPG